MMPIMKLGNFIGSESTRLLLISAGLAVLALGKAALTVPVPQAPGGNRARVSGAAVGSTAPDFTLPDSDGSPVTLSKYRGQWVVLHFMIITCPHCREVDEVLKKMRREYPTQFQPLDIAVPGHRIDDLADFKKSQGITYPVLFGQQRTMVDYFGGPVGMVPAFVLIGPSGEVLEIRNAAREADKDFFANTAQSLEAMIRRAILPK